HPQGGGARPVPPKNSRLRFTNPVDIAFLPPMLDMMDVLVDELRAARGASAAHAASGAGAGEGARAAVDGVTARAMMGRSHAPQHRFQSFWYGGPLSPYELFCLRSF